MDWEEREKQRTYRYQYPSRRTAGWVNGNNECGPYQNQKYSVVMPRFRVYSQPELDSLAAAIRAHLMAKYEAQTPGVKEAQALLDQGNEFIRYSKPYIVFNSLISKINADGLMTTQMQWDNMYDTATQQDEHGNITLNLGNWARLGSDYRCKAITPELQIDDGLIPQDIEVTLKAVEVVQKAQTCLEEAMLWYGSRAKTAQHAAKSWPGSEIWMHEDAKRRIKISSTSRMPIIPPPYKVTLDDINAASGIVRLHRKERG